MNENALNQQPKTLLDALVVMRPLLSKSMQSELDVLQQLFANLHCETVKELLSKVNDLVKKAGKNIDPATALIGKIEKYFASTDALTSKEEFVSADANESHEASTEEFPPSLEALVEAFRKSTRKTIKEVAKKFDVNLVAPDDAGKFEDWLRTGKKPESVHEVLEKELKPIAQQVSDYVDAHPSQQPEETIDRVLQIGEDVKSKYKIEGLKIFLQILGINSSGKTAKVLLNQLKAHYTQILSMGGKSA